MESENIKEWTDVELFVKLREGDSHSFTEIVNRYSDKLFRIIQKRVSDKDDCQDILQDIFISLWRRRQDIHITDSFFPYLSKAVQYEVIDFMVKKDKKIKREFLLAEKDDLDICTTDHFEDKIHADELDNLITCEVDRMPKTMKAVFTLSRKHALSIQEIATQLALSEQTVKNNISLAISKLKSRFKFN